MCCDHYRADAFGLKSYDVPVGALADNAKERTSVVLQVQEQSSVAKGACLELDSTGELGPVIFLHRRSTMKATSQTQQGLPSQTPDFSR